VTRRPGARTRSAPDETSLALRAIGLGWALTGKPSAGQQTFRRRAAAPSILAELVLLVDQAADMKWALARLRLESCQSASSESIVTATFERRLEAAIGAATREALNRRRAAGSRLGRRPLIPETILAQIARDRESGKSYRRIAQDLQAAGVPTAQGGREWRASTVRAAHLRALQGVPD
jgi:hypothetical protein